jgi:tetratricopeptide (TPR) repeat protein
LPRDAAQHFRGLYRAEDADTLPLWPILAITPDAAKVQRFQTLLPVAPKSVTPVAPNAAPACYADTWVDSGNGQKTTEIWDRLLDVRPFLAIEAPEYLECLLCEDNVETALARFATRLYVLPDTVSIRQRTARGIALEAQRQLDAYPYASLVLARYAQELDGHYGVPVDTECAALERLDRWNEGTVAAKRALALDPEDAHALMHMDGCFAPPERRPLRVSYWREFVQKHPCAVNARRWLAQAFEETQNTDGAVRALTEAMRLAPGDVTLPDKLATLLLRYRRYEEAATVLRAALPRFPASPQLHQQLVRALCGAGRYDDARDAFRRCPLMPPDLEAALAECKARAFANAPGT